MIRIQVQLTEAQTEKLRRIAAARGVSIAQVIRDAVDRIPERDDRAERWTRALAVIGRFHDIEGRTDVGVRHDEYLGEAIETELRRGRPRT